MTVTDEVVAFVDTSLLRQRIRAMDDAARLAMFSTWGPFPDLADEAGVSVVLLPAVYADIERLVAAHEPPAPGLLTGLRRRFDEMPPGCRIEVNRRLAHVSLEGLDFADPATFTLGRAMVAEQILNEVTAGADTQVNDVLGPLPAAGDIITAPVADAAALADVIDWAKLSVADTLAAVAASPGRAAEALAAEHRRGKPRSGVVTKLAPLVGGDAACPPAPAPVAPAGESSGEGHAVSKEPSGSGGVGASGSPDPSPVSSDGAEANARPLTPAPSDVPPTTDPTGAVVDPPAVAAPSEAAWPPLKFAAILGRLGAEMIAVSNQIQARWSPKP